MRFYCEETFVDISKYSIVSAKTIADVFKAADANGMVIASNDWSDSLFESRCIADDDYTLLAIPSQSADVRMFVREWVTILSKCHLCDDKSTLAIYPCDAGSGSTRDVVVVHKKASLRFIHAVCDLLRSVIVIASIDPKWRAVDVTDFKSWVYTPMANDFFVCCNIAADSNLGRKMIVCLRSENPKADLSGLSDIPVVMECRREESCLRMRPYGRASELLSVESVTTLGGLYRQLADNQVLIITRDNE